MPSAHSQALKPLQQFHIWQLAWLCFVKKRLAAAKVETSHADVAHMRSGENQRKDHNGCVYGRHLQ